MAYFYRRKSGRFYARIRVPEELQPHFCTQELRRSLNTTDRALACHLALAAALQWKAEFARLSGDMDLEKLLAGSPLLSSGGLIKLADAAIEMGLSVTELFDQFKARKLGLDIQVSGLMGAEVSELVFDDGGPCIDVGETLAGHSLRPVFGVLRLRPDSVAYTTGEIFEECAFRNGKGGLVVLAYPGVETPVRELLAARADCERVRIALTAAITPAMREVARPAPAPNAEVFEAVREAVMGEAYKHRAMRCSALLEAFYRDSGWSIATLDKNKPLHGLFVELMGDPSIGDIDRDMLREYKRRAAEVPHRHNSLRQKGWAYHGLSLEALIEAGKRDDLELLGEERAARRVADLDAPFKWAVANGFMRENPASGTSLKPAPMVKAKEKREAFDTALLARIFTFYSWWHDGRGQLTKNSGIHRSFTPFKYWMPLLALYSGARLNELAQLHVKDVTQTEFGTWYLDFNLEGEGKMDKDADEVEGGDSEEISEDEKRLKTANAIRKIALHPELLRLGFVEYVKAVGDAGHVRIFPELSLDRTKGYGKYAGAWFNGKFLGLQLKIPRNGKYTFHSFRHSFITACTRQKMDTQMRNELAGHSPGGGAGEKTYNKDFKPDEQFDSISRVNFELPPIAPLDVADGMNALSAALVRNSTLKSQRNAARALEATVRN